MTSFPKRMLRAALLHADTYEEVEADPRSIRQATAVVIGACAAIGIASYAASSSAGVSTHPLLIRVTLSILEPLVIWTGGSAFCYMVGASFFRGPETETDYREVLRTTGFAFTPALLRVFALVPPASVGLVIDVAARVWVFIAFVVAVRQALDFTTGRAVGTFGIAVILLWLILWGLAVAPLPF